MFYKLRTLEYDRIDVSKRIDVKKAGGSCECIINCQYWYFVYINFKFQSEMYNGCHNLIQKVFNFNDVAIVYVKGNDYRLHFWYTSKDKAIDLSRNAALTEKIGAF